MSTPVITVEPLTAGLIAAHQAGRGVVHSLGVPAAPPGSLVITERYQGHVTILSAASECPNGLDAAARAWAESTGAALSEAAA